MRKKIIIFFIVSLFIFQASDIFAVETTSMEELVEEINALKERIAELEKRCEMQDRVIEESRSKWKEAREKFEHIDTHILHKDEEAGYALGEGFRIGAGATMVTQLAINPNTEPSDDDEVADATYSIDIEMEKTIGENGLAFLHLEAGDGGGLDDDEITTFSAVNRDAADSDNDVEVTEV